MVTQHWSCSFRSKLPGITLEQERGSQSDIELLMSLQP